VQGGFSIDGIPPGDYLVEVWHEDLGVKSARATVAVSGTVQLDFTYSSK
jgi:hypothetical protein